METHTKLSILFSCILLCSCYSSNHTNPHKSPEIKAKAFNYNANQANYIVTYNVKHKKLRQKIADQNRRISQERLLKLNKGKGIADGRSDNEAPITTP